MSKIKRSKRILVSGTLPPPILKEVTLKKFIYTIGNLISYLLVLT